jgi:hypothetical protein
MGIFDKVKKFADDIEKKVENLDEKGKKLAEKLKMDDSTESVEVDESQIGKNSENLTDRRCYLRLKYTTGGDVLRGDRLGDVNFNIQSSKVYLPNGEIDFLAVKPSGSSFNIKLPEGTCEFLNLRSTVVRLNGGKIFGMYVCGDALITIKDLGYDLSTKEGIKKAKNNKDKIRHRYEQLKKENLALFLEQANERKQKSLELKTLYKKEKKKEIQKKETLRNKKEALRNNIIKLLKDKAIKMPVSDIDAFLKHQNVDEIKEYCEEMYHNGDISRTSNYRYFILTEEKKKPKPKKTSAPKSEEVDVEKELEKLKGLLDKGLITQEAYDAKMNQLLGL